ncbi:MAG: 50S ribosomal protein L4 [Planctomycetota bacterium]|nr:50S ribosomal protein L4 [Planctomycetota bacterium]
MASLPVFDRLGKEVGSYEVDPAEIAPRISKQLLHDAVLMYQCNARQGTVRTRTRGEVAGSTKKMYRQKGTGNARAGSRRSGVRRGGGHIFAIRPRDYSYRMPKKAVRLATRMAIASKIIDGEVVVLDDLAMAAPRTKEMAAILKALQLQGVTTLLALPERDTNIYKSARNIEGVTVSPVADLNALAVLRPRRLLVTKSALDAIRQRVASEASAGSQG